MNDPGATLKTDGIDDPITRQPGKPETRPVETKRVRKQKFAYQSGSQPLLGYTIKRGIGVGGFGEVYFALSDAGKEVALKCIQRNLDVELRGVRQCLNLKHINLIRLWDICTSDDGESWVVMEYVPGESLREIVEAHSNGMPMELVNRWFLSTASGVAYLHSRGIVHRDLKPGNIFFDQDEQIIKIGDYGLSKFISCSRRSGQTESVGTFHYMAPEIGKGAYGKEIDVYAMGIILFEMITGTVPFDGESSQEIIMKHLTADPDISRIPEPYASIVAKAMRKDPEQRYRNVHEMINDYPSDGSLPEHIGPIVPLQDVAQNQTPARADDRSADDQSTVPPIQPLIIDDQDIVFGQVQNVDPADSVESPINFDDTTLKVNPDATNNGEHVVPLSQAAQQHVVEVERVEVVAADDAFAPDEPIARAVASGWGKFKTWWFSGKLNAPLKVILVVIAALVILKNSEWLLPTALALGLAYLIYYAVRAWTLKHPKPKKQEKPKFATTLPAKKPITKKEMAAQTQKDMRNILANRAVTDRFTELIGSMLVAAFVVLILGILGFAVASIGEERGVDFLSMVVWAMLISLVGSWLLLIVGKFFESSNGEQLMRRFTMLGIGLVVGISAIFVGNFLELGLEIDSVVASDLNTELPLIEDRFYPEQIGNSWPAYLISFAGIFAVLRWWRQSDPIRKTRISLFSVGICIVCAILFGSIFGLDLAWLGIVAGTTAVVTQLSSPWIHPKNRSKWLRDRSVAGVNHDTQVAG